MKKTLIILIGLIIILIGLSLLMKKNAHKEKAIVLKINNRQKIIKFSKLQKLPHKKIVTQKGKTYQGIKLGDVINLQTNDKISSVKIVSSDGMSIKLTKDIQNAYLVFIKDKNYYRLVIPTDDFSQRWIKYISEIILHK